MQDKTCLGTDLALMAQLDGKARGALRAFLQTLVGDGAPDDGGTPSAPL